MNYLVELTEDDRCNLLIALGSFAGACQGNVPEPWQVLVRKIAALSPARNAMLRDEPIGAGKAAAAAILSPPATANPTVPADHWAKKKPDSWETIEVPISKVEQKPGANGPYLRVTWPNQGRGFSYGSVFDEVLFSCIRDREGKKTTLYIAKAGKFTNIVGVRA